MQMSALLRKPQPHNSLLLPFIICPPHNVPTIRPVEAIGTGSGSETRLPFPRPPLPLPRPPHLNPNCHLFRRPLQISRLLPRVRSLSPHLQSLPLITTSPFTSESESASNSDSDTNLNTNPNEEADRVCKVIDELFASNNRNMEAVLDELDINLSSELVVNVLHRFLHAYKPAFRFFKWVESRNGFVCDSAICAKMLSVLAKGKQFESMVDLLEDMGGKGLLSVEGFKVSIKAFAKEREMKKAVGVLKMMKRFGFDGGVEGFNCLIDSLAKAKLAKEADELVEKMKDQIDMNLKTYSVVLNGYCLVKNLVEAGRVWNEILDVGFKPDVAAYNIMLEGLIRGQRRPEAIKLFELMKAKGPNPNPRTYTILIQDLCKVQKMDRAVACFDEMINSGCAPDVATYTCLITGFGNSRQMDKVSGLLREMSENGCPPDGRTYNALIKLMTNRNMAEDAVRIYKKMIRSGFEPTIHTYNMMMKCYFRKNYEMGCAVWEEMGRKGICPDVNSYTVFIGGHVRHGRSDIACNYIEEMMNKGMRAPEIDYNKFGADFSKAGKPDVLYELAQKMKLLGKFQVSNVLNDWAERSNKGFKRRVINQTGGPLF